MGVNWHLVWSIVLPKEQETGNHAQLNWSELLKKSLFLDNCIKNKILSNLDKVRTISSQTHKKIDELL